MSAPLNIHANALVVGGAGLLIRGPSGSGKSGLTLALVDEALARGLPAALIADDRVLVSAFESRLIAQGLPGFEGMIEWRGGGLMHLPHEPSATLRLVIDLSELGVAPTRYPEPEARNVEICGVNLPRVNLDLRPGLVFAARMTLRRLGFDLAPNVLQLVKALDQSAAVHKNVPVRASS